MSSEIIEKINRLLSTLYFATHQPGLYQVRQLIMSLEQENKRLRELLENAKCPDCDEIGIDSMRCQWCNQKKQALEGK